MTSRERVLVALEHREPDRVPCDYWAAPEVTAKLCRHFGLADKDELLKYLKVDFRVIPGPAYIGPEPARHPDGTEDDIWGVSRQVVTYELSGGKGSYKEVVCSPLAKASTIKEIDDYTGWPRAEWFDFSEIARQCGEYPDTAIVNAGDRLNRVAQLKPAMYLRGIDRILMDLVLNPGIAEAVISHISEFYFAYCERLFSAAGGKIDIFMMGDDFGTQNGLFISRDMWKKYFGRNFRRYIECAHRHGIKVMHHSCGSIRPLIPDMIDAGLDILQSLQPEAKGMEPFELKKEFGKHISFQGSISIQRTMPRGAPEDVRREVKDRIKALGPGGGFIICTAHNIQLDTPVENIVALFEAYRECGEYPIDL